MTGERWGRWLVLELAHCEHSGAYWLCRCDCGTVKVVSGMALRSGESQSCRCLSNELRTKHGQAGYRNKTSYRPATKEYNAWADAKHRCYNPKNKRWHCYGAIGITMCAEWINDFAAFFAHMGKCPKGWSLGRIDVTKGYEPGNCEWQDTFKQANSKSNNRTFSLGTKEMTVAEWGRFSALNPAFLYQRLDQGWTPYKIFCNYLPLTNDSFRLWFAQVEVC